MSGAEQLSQAIMESGMFPVEDFGSSPNFTLWLWSFKDLSVVRPNHDLQAQLTHRKERLSFLIKFINDNGVLTKASVILFPNF